MSVKIGEIEISKFLKDCSDLSRVDAHYEDIPEAPRHEDKTASDFSLSGNRNTLTSPTMKDTQIKASRFAAVAPVNSDKEGFPVEGMADLMANLGQVGLEKLKKPTVDLSQDAANMGNLFLDMLKNRIKN